MGRTFYLTDEEIKAIRDTCGEWIEMMGDADDVSPIDIRLQNGLGSSMKKLYKGLRGEAVYAKY